MALDINEHYDKIYRFCYLRVSNRETAEDLTQETFLRYLEHPQYHNIDKTLQLLYTIARNLCSDEFRRRKFEELPEDTLADENIEDIVLTNFSLKEALGHLAGDLHHEFASEIILLRYVNEVPLNVIAGIYSVSRFALNRRIKKILGYLQDYIGKEGLL